MISDYVKPGKRCFCKYKLICNFAQNPHLIPIGAPIQRIDKRDASQNCPAEFLCCNNNNKGIIEPKEEEISGASTPKKSVSPSTSKNYERKQRNKNISSGTTSNKSNKEESVLKENQTNSGTYMTDDEKLALRKAV